jgi:hypothetical protein
MFDLLTNTEGTKQKCQSVIPGFHHVVNENCAVLGYYAANSGNFLPTFRAMNPSRILGP